MLSKIINSQQGLPQKMCKKRMEENIFPDWMHDLVSIQGKKGRSGREIVRHNDGNMMAENVGEDRGHDIRRRVTEETSRRIDCMQRIS